jgi:hypothetical protein
VDDLHLDEDGNMDSIVEPAPIQTSEDERLESSTVEEAKFSSDEAGADEAEKEPEQPVPLPVEMDEPEPTEPIRGRPKTGKKKSAGSGLAGLFSSSRPSSRTRSGNKREEARPPPEQEAEEAEEAPEAEERPFENRRKSESKGLGSLFASKRNKPRRPRPLSGPPAGAARDREEPEAEPEPEPEREEPARLLRRERSTGLSGFLFSSRRGPPAKSTGNLAERRKEPEPREEETEEKPSYTNSTSSLNRQKREKGLSAIFGAPKSRQSGRKQLPRSTTFPLPQRSPQPPPPPRQEPDTDDDLQVQQQQQQYQTPQQLEQSPRQLRVQPSPQLSAGRVSEDQRPQLPLPAEAANQYSPTPKQQDVYDQIEVLNDQPASQRTPEARTEAPRDPHRQMGRRSGRFRRPQDGANNTSVSSLNSSQRQTSAASTPAAATPPKPETTQDMMRDMFAEKVIRKPLHGGPAPRTPTEDSNAASGLGADFEYEKAMRAGGGHEGRSRPASNKRATSASNVGRTESYRQAHTAAPAPDRDRKMANYNSLPRLGGPKRRPTSARRSAQPQPQDPEDPDNYDSRSLGDRPRSRNAKVEDPCSLM